MNPISATAQSGMQAATVRLGAAAHNIANLGTDGFHRQTVTQSPASGGGVSSQVRTEAQPGENLIADTVTQLEARTAFEANLDVLRTSDEMIGSLLDVRA